MALKDFFQKLTSQLPKLDTTKIRDRLSFVHLFGYEKSYGAPHPQDYDSMVATYKSWVYACVNKNATSVAKNKLCLYTKSYTETGEEELKKLKDPNHPFYQVIKNVNPFSNQYDLFTITQTYLELTGNAYWWIPRNTLGVPYMIWNLPAHWMRVVPSETEFISGYVMKVPQKGQFIPFDENEIIHFKFPSPFNLFYGTGPTLAAQFGINLNEQMKTWGINYFLNNAQPGGALITENSLSEEQYMRLRDEWNRKHKGSKNAGKMAFLEGGLKYEEFGSNVRDARFELVSREARDEICAMYGIPASKLGLVEDVNRANADANDYTYQKETILPRLILIEEKLNEKMIPIYDANLVCKFDNPVPDDNEFRLKEKQINIQTGITTIDEERAKEGLEPFNLPQTSKPLIPFNLVPAGEEPPQTDAFGNPTDGKDNKDKEDKSLVKSKDSKWSVFVHTTSPQEKLFAGTMRRYFESQHKEVMQNLHQVRSANAVTKDLFSFIMFSLKEANQKLRIVSKPNVRQAFVAGLQLGMADTNSSIDFNLFEPNILRAVEQRLNGLEKINDSTAQLLQDELKQAFENGESIDDVSKRIDKIYGYSRDFRSKRIAQTEIIGATNDGQVRAYREAGVKQKEWITSRDEHVRDSHKEAEGQVVDLDQSFVTGLGSHLQYPGDRSSGADASDIINCRCTVLPVIK